MFIRGEWVSGESGETFPDLNPATLEELARIPLAGPGDVDAAVEAALDALEGWRDTPAPLRARILFRAARMLEERKEELARLMTQEMGKVLAEARGDVQEAIDITYYAAGEGRRLFGETTPSELPDKLCMTVRQPLGVVALITPWNFPMAIPAWKLMPALVAGNTIVFKPASDTPMLALELVKILEEAGLPPGVVNVVLGPGGSVGAGLVKNNKIRAVSFTGSLETGRWIMETAGRQLKRVSLELGGKNPILVMDDANLELAVDGAVWGAFGTTGQRCTAASRIIVHEKVIEKFTRMLIARTRKLIVGDGLKTETDIGPVINQVQLDKIAGYIEVGLEEGAELAFGGRKINPLPGYFFEPTIFTRVKPDMRIAQEEIFGPITCILEARDLEEAIEIANSTQYGLSSSIYTQDVNRAMKAMEKLEAGITYINSSTIGAEVHLPFGGVKSTGNGFREAGPTAVEEFTEIKTIYIDYSGRLQKAQIDTE